jgi:cytochrome c peroxidase
VAAAVALVMMALGAAAAEADPGRGRPGVPEAPALARLAAPPLGLPRVPLPAGDSPTPARIALGRKLFFDRRLSGNGTMSCGMCHIPEQGFTNNELARPVGVEGRSLRRNAPALFNVAYVERLFHDGRERRLETQVWGPLLHPAEMANPSADAVVARIAGLADYGDLFQDAYGAAPSVERIGRAIASYERTLLSGNSPFDRWHFGKELDALTPEAIEGFGLFTGQAGCAACHRIEPTHALFTDGDFHDTGIGYLTAIVRSADRSPVTVELAPGVSVPLPRASIESVSDPPTRDDGRHEVTRDPADRWRFRTPSLRSVALSGPYMHDGSLPTLTDVVQYYNRGGHPHPGLDPRIRPLGLYDREIAALVAFLESLTGDDVQTLIDEARAVRRRRQREIPDRARLEPAEKPESSGVGGSEEVFEGRPRDIERGRDAVVANGAKGRPNAEPECVGDAKAGWDCCRVVRPLAYAGLLEQERRPHRVGADVLGSRPSRLQSAETCSGMAIYGHFVPGGNRADLRRPAH